METTKNYSYSMSVLYQTLRIVLLNAANNLAALAAFKSKYTTTLINALKAELEAAEALKNDQARKAEHEALRVTLVGFGAECCDLFQDLKRYIADAFKDTTEIMWDAAGWQNYAAASNENWDKLRDMMNMMATFIDENETKLTEDGFMPDLYLTSFTEKRGEFNTTYDAFILALQNAEGGTAQKITANNAIKDKVAELCADAQTKFKNDEVKKKLFVMDAVAEKIQPTGASTIVVELKNAETGAVVPGFALTNVTTERTVTGNGEGRAEMGQQAEGSTRYRIVADGFPEEEITVDLKVGTKTIERISLTPIISEAAKAEIEESAAPTEEKEMVIEK